jgi:hypothetical protein
MIVAPSRRRVSQHGFWAGKPAFFANLSNRQTSLVPDMVKWGIMNVSGHDNRSPIAIGLEWSSRVMVIGLEMAVPAACGYWLDNRFGTMPIFVCLGAILGFAAGMLQLLRIVRELGPKKK